MKTFKDLGFKPHPIGNGFQAIMFFENGYGVSVVNFRGAYVSGPDEWELAVLKGTEKSFDLCYSTPITDDVIGHLKRAGVTRIMKKVQALKGPQ